MPLVEFFSARTGSCHSTNKSTAYLSGSCPECGGKEKWRILPVGANAKEWASRIDPRYQRRMPEVNEAVVATYLAGGNTRRIRGALQPLLKAAPLSKSTV